MHVKKIFALLLTCTVSCRGGISSHTDIANHTAAITTASQDDTSLTKEEEQKQVEQPDKHALQDTTKDCNNTEQQIQMKCALLSSAIGDAMGRITEFVSKRKDLAALSINWLDDIKKISLPNGQSGYPYTDDTLMMRIVLEETQQNMQQPEKTIDALAKRFAELFDETKKYTIDPLFDLRAHGLTNTRACKELAKLAAAGKHWSERKATYDIIKKETGCGSVMRVWPIGFLYRNNIDQAIQLADMQSCLTHRNPAARAACAAAVAGFAALCNGKTVTEVAQAMINAAERYKDEESRYKHNLIPFSENLAANQQAIAQDRFATSDMLRYAFWAAKNAIESDKILGESNNLQDNYRSATGALLGWRADEAIAAALYVFAKHGDNITAVIQEAVNTPGDSDSIAAIAGAFSGYLYGDLNALLEKPGVLEVENVQELLQSPVTN